MSRKIKDGTLQRQGGTENGSVNNAAGVNSSGEIAGQMLAPAVAAANNP